MSDAPQSAADSQGAAVPANQRYNRLATLSIVASFLGLAMLVPIAGSIIGIVFGRRAVRVIDKTGERGGGAAQAAIVFGWFGLVEVTIVAVFVVIILVSAANS
jgi:uncharacterized protein YacL